MSGRDLVVVAGRLPVEYADAEGWRPSPGGVVSCLSAALDGRDATWIGWGGRSAEAHIPEVVLPDGAGARLREVRPTEADLAGHYEGFCNAALWPLYHDAIVGPAFHREDFGAYRRVNEAFAQEVAQAAPAGATVWMHDYQLQLLPRLLRQARPDLRLGFFLHIPFPPEALFRRLPWRREILDGLLGADLLGFQTDADVAHFGASALRFAEIEMREGHVVEGERRIEVGAFPVGADARGFAALAQADSVRRRAAEIRSELGDPDLLLLGVDRLDYAKGIETRIRAVAELLGDPGALPSSTAYLQVSPLSRQGVEGYLRLAGDVELQAKLASESVDGRIHYRSQSVSREELAAMYVAADIVLVTSLRDGMNLVCKEYVACRQDGSGALVLSENAGAAVSMPQAWRVNPYDVEDIKDAIVAAATASPDDGRRRMAALRDGVMAHDAAAWAEGFLARMA